MDIALASIANDLQINPNNYISLPFRFKNNIEIVCILMTTAGHMIKHVPNWMLADESVQYSSVMNDGTNLRFIPFHLQKETAVVAAIRNNFIALNYTAPEFRDDPNLIMLGTQQNADAFRFASDRIKNNFKLLEIFVVVDVDILEHVSCDIRDCYDFMIAAVNENPWAFIYASYKLKDNFNMVRSICSVPEIFEYASLRRQKDKNIWRRILELSK